MPPYGNARADWNIYPGRVVTIDAPHSPDAEFVKRITATINDHEQSYAETMESVTRIANEWRARDTTPRELERLARLIFHTSEPDDSWSDAPEHVRELYRQRAVTLLESGYRKVDR
ncbi:MAG: hypothetical protein JWQ64_652 [Subtercola sp.]|jgi:hypothetical protein|nr:hypothetical protein [Subtercola sp.]